jgi:hypothetical protein
MITVLELIRLTGAELSRIAHEFTPIVEIRNSTALGPGDILRHALFSDEKIQIDPKLHLGALCVDDDIIAFPHIRAKIGA